MATAMTKSSSVLQNYFLHANSEDQKILLKSLKEARNYIRGRHSSTKIEQFRNSGGLEILVKLLRENVSSSTTKHRPDDKTDNSNINVRPSTSTSTSCKINVTVGLKGKTTTPSRTKLHSSKVKAVSNAVAQTKQIDDECKRKAGRSKEEISRTDILTMCVSILATCCTEADSRTTVKNAGCVTVLARILKHESDEGVINRTARAIANLAKLLELSACFHKQEFIPCLVQHLHTSEDCNTKYSLVRALKILADTPDHCLAIIHHGGIKVVLNSLTTTDANLVGLSIETLAEMTHPYNFNHLKKPSWIKLWEAVGTQAAEAVDLILRLKEETKPSIADQAFVLLNNLMNSKAVRLAVGRSDKIPEFIKLCSSSDVASPLPYLQCLAMCCKESVNRAKVKQSNGLDVFVKVLKSSKILREKHIAIAGLVQFYHDDIAVRYLCVSGLIECLTNYLSSYIERDLEVPLMHFVKPNYNFEKSQRIVSTRALHGNEVSSQGGFYLSDTPREPLIAWESCKQEHRSGKCTNSITLLVTETSDDLICVPNDKPLEHSRLKKDAMMITNNTDDDSVTVGRNSSLDCNTRRRCKGNSVLEESAENVTVTAGTELDGTSSGALRFLTPTNMPQEDGRISRLTSSNTQLKEGDNKAYVNASSPVSVNDENLYDEYSVFLDQSPTPYSPPSVDWSNVFALREQQGYRGLSPQSNLSSRSNSTEREIPKYQYSSDRSVSPNSDVSWKIADQGEEGVQYSPVVSDEEDNMEESCNFVSEQTMAMEDPTSSIVDPTGCISVLPSTSKQLNLQTLPHSSCLPSPSKRSRSPSVDSSYESEVLDDLPLDACKPEGYALHLLYKCSFMDDTLEYLANFHVIDVLLKLALYCTQFKNKSTRILHSILGSHLVFEQLLSIGIPHYLNMSWAGFTSEVVLLPGGKFKESELKRDVGHAGTTFKDGNYRSPDGKQKKRKSCQYKYGVPHSCSFLQKLTEVAESSFGMGVFDHLFNSAEISRKMAAFDALSILCRSQDSLIFHLIECNTLHQLVAFFQSPATSSAEKAILVRCLQRLSQTVKLQVTHSTAEDQQASSNILRNIKQSTKCKRQSSCDPENIKLLLDDSSFVLANRTLLAERSDYFQRMLQGSYKESKEDMVKITDVSKATLEMIIHHLYGCKWQHCTIYNDVNLETGMEVLSTAGKFLLPELQENVCNYCLQDQINSENVCNICLFSISHGCRSLWRYCLKFMITNESVKVNSFIELASSLFGEESFQEFKSIVKDATRKLL